MERTLTYVLGYLLQAKEAGGGTTKDAWRRAWDDGHALAIKLRADNDFYSQTSQVRRTNRLRNLPYPESTERSHELRFCNSDGRPSGERNVSSLQK